ncbi:NUDIX hydrolase [Sediminibacterium sp. TEGAF015]|uniref:NUDIX hydrolase n=1 Tax=Sediminibacterium sp. TEGAF015 TaxID=575378 RepID=UPI00220B90D7|nr:NUDIX hydrolase [Sediminibacterium sp. TEGAF015]BDQ11077.1 NUDIX hydrolase [Sediminibacterium sp. TEGAF015]
MEKWELLHSEQLVKDKWADVRKNSYRKNDGSVIEPFYIYGFPDYATALAITKRGTVIVERIYRPGINEIILELPGGCVDATDTMLETAIERELLEETGYRFEHIEYLGKISPNPNTNTNVMHMFLATGGEEDPSAVRDTEEEVEVLELEWDQFIEDFKSQKFVQSMQTSTILYALMKLNKLIVY